jgi:lipoprotein-releasing system permease protein
MNLSFFIARRYLFSKKSHNAINIITLISVFCVAIVTIALVIILSGLNGLTNLVESRYNSFNADIQISVKAGKTFEVDSIRRLQLHKLKELASYTEVLEENALLNFNEKQIIGTVKGVGPEFEAMTHFDTLMRWGRFNLGGDSMAYAVIGRGLEQRLDIPNENNFTPIRVFVPKKGADLSPTPGNIEQPFNKKNVYVSGAFTIADDFDYKYMLVSIGFARKLLGDPKATSSIELSLKTGSDKKEVQEAVKKIVGTAFQVKNRYQQNELLFKTLQSEKLWTSMILVFVLIIATFNIIGSLTMLIIEKQKDIHTLSSMGADVSLIRNIFFTEGLLISFLGSISGLVVGVLICLLQIKYGLVRFGEGKMVVDAYPVAIEVSDLVAILVFVMLIGFFAAWYPVRVFTRKHTISTV